jgi:hypothetical protein
MCAQKLREYAALVFTQGAWQEREASCAVKTRTVAVEDRMPALVYLLSALRQ